MQVLKKNLEGSDQEADVDVIAGDLRSVRSSIKQLKALRWKAQKLCRTSHTPAWRFSSQGIFDNSLREKESSCTKRKEAGNNVDVFAMEMWMQVDCNS